jgi:zinc-ribbon domain
MFCTQCGNNVDEHDRFCRQCGHDLDVDANPAVEPSSVWHESVDYSTVFNHPDVKSLIVAAAGKKPGGMSAEDFLSAAEPLLGAAGVTVPLNAAARIGQSVYARLGVKTGKEVSASFPSPPGRVIAAVLCSLAARGQALDSAEQATDGCTMTATLPSSMWAFRGTLVATVQAEPSATRVVAATSIPGQLYDWGHSKRVLNSLVEDIGSFLDLQE